MNESWQQVSSQIESILSDATFSDQEIKKARGNMRRMVNLIHQKTGDTTSEIFQKISAII